MVKYYTYTMELYFAGQRLSKTELSKIRINPKFDLNYLDTMIILGSREKWNYQDGLKDIIPAGVKVVLTNEEDLENKIVEVFQF